MLAELYGYTVEYCLYSLTFSQALSLLDTRNERERKANEAAEERSREQDNPGYFDPSSHKIDENTPIDSLPTLGDLRNAFGGMIG